MRKPWIIACVLVAGLLAGSTAEAISRGPGGRVYYGGMVTVDTTTCNRIGSMGITPDWDNIGYGMVHGDICDNYNPYGAHDAMGQSPEVYQGGEYATLVLGAYYDRTVAGRTCLDVLKVQTSADCLTSGDIIVLGNGKVNSTPGGWDGRNECCTESGAFAAPDVMGGFTGDSLNNFVLHSGSYSMYANILTDHFTDGDCTDNDEDYIDRNTVGINGHENDFEIVGDRLFWSDGWGPKGAADGVQYLKRESQGTWSQHDFIWDDSSISLHYPYTLPWDLPHGRFAAAQLNGHYTVWHLAYGNPDNINSPNKEWFLGVFTDLNNDGDAIDNAEVTGTIDEFQACYRVGSATTAYDDPKTGWGEGGDLEYIEHGDNKFLLVYSPSQNWSYGAALIVLELEDNGDYVGGNDGVKVICRGNERIGGAWTTVRYMTGQMEFGAVPEPGTMLLLGSSALGILGYLRRRRMR